MQNGQQHLDYADDICLLTHSVLDAENMLYSLENEAASFGLKSNFGKTQSKSIVNSSTTMQPRPNAIVVNGHPVEDVNQFTCLGSEICKDGGSDADVDCRVRQTKRAFGILSTIWRKSLCPNSLKVCIFKSNVVSVLLYGSSTWKVTKSITSKLQVFVNRCLRSIFHIYWPNTISNMNLWKIADMQQIDVIIKRHKWGWIGLDSVARQAMQWNPLDGIGRRKERPCRRGDVETNCGKGVEESKQILA